VCVYEVNDCGKGLEGIEIRAEDGLQGEAQVRSEDNEEVEKLRWGKIT
jgi:hypothetical protein